MYSFINCTREVVESDMFFMVGLAFVADLLTGHIKAILTKTPSSSISLDGLLKNMLRVMGALFGASVAKYLHADIIGTSILGFVLVGYGTSILENYVASGIHVPKFLQDMFKEYYDKYNEGEN